ncbi:hypothetical protein HNO88_000136 [Novosphingobium chloroacetimidivorans]|uniref:Elongation factor P n=1 Tax=Novosphingobium chloroacetimidivorans TaxID=1428314 RepID=A0A7W7K6X9_9SPHN|nr:hypothetical protein [Novosphingobium chloroacetimidivorans]MBB4856839.1 hypothetical protein [Novosphingobium chloroacetimidivorans]
MRRALPAARRSAAFVSVLCVAALGITLASPVLAARKVPPVPGGLIGTLDPGKYSCELPGDASGPTRIQATEFDFTVVRGSSYRAAGRRGSYLLTGDVVQMTGGKLKGLKLHRVSDGFLRRIEPNGQDGELRCILGTPGNS